MLRRRCRRAAAPPKHPRRVRAALALWGRGAPHHACRASPPLRAPCRPVTRAAAAVAVATVRRESAAISRAR